MKIIIESEEELKVIAATFLHISVNMRYYQKEWNEHHGKILLDRKKYWEEKMDEFLKKLGAEKTRLSGEVHISIKNENE